MRIHRTIAAVLLGLPAAACIAEPVPSRGELVSAIEQQGDAYAGMSRQELITALESKLDSIHRLHTLMVLEEDLDDAARDALAERHAQISGGLLDLRLQETEALVGDEAGEADEADEDWEERRNRLIERAQALEQDVVHLAEERLPSAP
jgi:hypothetical protein